MNFLKSLGSFTGYNLPYTITSKICESNAESLNSNSIWTISEAVSKSDGSPCTVFDFDVKNPRNSNYVALAKNASRKLKSTRIPGVLRVIDTIETDSNIYIVLEPVLPLSIYIARNGNPSSEATLLGLYVLSRALMHLHVDGKSVHGAVDIDLVFVGASGEWRLGGFELVTNTESDSEQAIYRLSAAHITFRNITPPEVSLKGIDALRGKVVFKLDSYKLGVLIWCLYNNRGSSEVSTTNLLTLAKIPKSLQAGYKKLVQNSPTARVSIEDFLSLGERSYFKTPLILLYRELDEINLKSTAEKLEFMKSLETIKTVAPDGFMEHRVLPELVRLFGVSVQPGSLQQDMAGAATALYYILLLLERLEDTAFQKLVSPVVVQAFAMPDRAIRVTLLTALPTYVDKLTKSDISDRIFLHFLTGFSDTNSTVREETLKGVLPISGKLTDRQLSNDLLRYLAKLQNDDKPEIRTNTVICLCKIARHLNLSSRPGVLITAYNKSLKDKFMPARNAALLSFEACIGYFTPEICCSRVLSSVAPCLLDKLAKVRAQARKVFDMYMAKIEEEAERLPVTNDEDEEDNFAVPTTEPEEDNTNGFSFSLGGLNLSFGGAISKIGGVVDGETISAKSSTSISRSETPIIQDAPSIKKNESKKMEQKNVPANSLWDDEGDEEEFSDGWGDPEPVVAKLSIKPRTTKAPTSTMEAKQKRPQAKKEGGLKLNSKTTTRLNLKLDEDDEGDDGWDGW